METIFLLIFRALCCDYVHGIVFTTASIFHHFVQHDEATGYTD